MKKTTLQKVIEDTALALTLSFALAYILAVAGGLDAATLVLGTAPGGVAKMSLTVVALKLDVPLVTSLHLVRVISAALLVGLIYRLFIEPRIRILHRERSAVVGAG